LQDVRRIETKGPAVDDLIHTAVVEPADEEEGLAVEEVLHDVPECVQDCTWQTTCAHPVEARSACGSLVVNWTYLCGTGVVGAWRGAWECGLRA
jgi:hypothetical protein